MPIIKIIQPTPGPTTCERILSLIERSPDGILIREICQTLNRPVSLVQRYLKILLAEGKIRAQRSENGMQLVYYPTSKCCQLRGEHWQAVDSSSSGLKI